MIKGVRGLSVLYNMKNPLKEEYCRTYGDVHIPNNTVLMSYGSRGWRVVISLERTTCAPPTVSMSRIKSPEESWTKLWFTNFNKGSFNTKV